jgi:hypothetical protein
VIPKAEENKARYSLLNQEKNLNNIKLIDQTNLALTEELIKKKINKLVKTPMIIEISLSRSKV